MSDRLTEISVADLPKLSAIYASRRDADFGYVSYTTIETYIRWYQQDPNLDDVKSYCLNGDFSDGTFVMTDGILVYIDTLNPSYDNLSRAVRLVNYTKGYAFGGIRHEIFSTVLDTINQIGVPIPEFEEFLLYRLRMEKALQLDVNLPAGIHLKRIQDPIDLKKVNALWAYQNEGTPKFIQRMAKFNPSAGAYTDDGSLVSWMFRFPYSMVALLHTDTQHRGLGYGRLVVKAVSRQIAQLGQDVYANILDTNRASRSLFEKLGFEVVGKIH